MRREQLRPGPGWKHVAGAVWDHDSGIRIHVGGLSGVIGGTVIDGTRWPECRDLDWMIAVNGGNRKRGVMAWALSHQPSGG